jgi:hypothetical protein
LTVRAASVDHHLRLETQQSPVNVNTLAICEVYILQSACHTISLIDLQYIFINLSKLQSEQCLNYYNNLVKLIYAVPFDDCVVVLSLSSNFSSLMCYKHQSIKEIRMEEYPIMTNYQSYTV